MRTKNITLEVCVNNSPVTEYSKDGNRYIIGRKGSEYTLRVKNHTGEKVLFVPTIDGLSVVDGKPGHYDSPGYILGPYETYEITGWRISNQQTRKFEFVRHSKSYAKKIGESTDNLGVIGLMTFKEVVKTGWTVTPVIIPNSGRNDWPQWTNKIGPYYSGAGGGGSGGIGSASCGGGAGGSARGATKQLYSATASSLNRHTMSSTVKQEGQIVCDSAMPQATVGTGMGSEQKSVVQNAAFERQPLPFSTISVYYYERKQLEQMGVTRKVQREEHMPKAFPAASDFCRQV